MVLGTVRCRRRPQNRPMQITEISHKNNFPAWWPQSTTTGDTPTIRVICVKYIFHSKVKELLSSRGGDGQRRELSYFSKTLNGNKILIPKQAGMAFSQHKQELAVVTVVSLRIVCLSVVLPEPKTTDFGRGDSILTESNYNFYSVSLRRGHFSVHF